MKLNLPLIEIKNSEPVSLPKDQPDTPLGAFEPIVVKFKGRGLSKRITSLLREGEGLDEEYDGDNSSAIFAICIAMHSNGFSDNEIASELTNKENYLGNVAYNHTKTKDRNKAANWILKHSLRKAKKCVAKDREDHSLDDKAEELEKKRPMRKAASPYTLAHEFLASGLSTPNGELLIRYHCGHFFFYKQNKYVRSTLLEIKNSIMAFLQTMPHIRTRATSNLVNNIMAHLQPITSLSSDLKMPAMIGENGNTGRLISMKNGIFDVDKFILGESDFLKPHTPNFFSTACLPYDFDSTAKCPTWNKFLSEMLPDLEVQQFLQEWMGYNLVFDSTHHKFVLLVGEGANGKSVLCAVHRSIIGVGNYSAVGLEQFNMNKTYLLAAMVGKLANIAEEMGEIDKAAEGLLKIISAGGTYTIEEKYEPAFETVATARLTFATNVLPRFKDRSSGIWRRLILVPFKVQILDESKQNKKLTDQKWWESSGELPGIFNWALEGLIRLQARGHFVEPEACLAEKAEYKQNVNPAADFLSQFCVSELGGDGISSVELYSHFAAWAKSNGFTPLGSNNFSEEVRRQFPSAIYSGNAVRRNGTRSRRWSGINWADGNPPISYNMQRDLGSVDIEK